MKKSLILVAFAFVLWSCSSKETKPTPVEVKKEQVKVDHSKDEKHNPVSHAGPHWSYEGVLGPEIWGSIANEFNTCSSGKSQSPIDLIWKKPIPGGQMLFNYNGAATSAIDNGHTLQFNFPDGSNSIELRGHKYELKQVHFHSFSEHTISGKHFPIEAHFVHKDEHGSLAVIGLMIDVGKHNADFDILLKNWPKLKNKQMPLTLVQLIPKNLLPKALTYYHYSGSLTTPPCSEGVNWNVLNTTIYASQEQIKSFREKYNNNYRPTQQLNGRKVINY